MDDSPPLLQNLLTNCILKFPNNYDISFSECIHVDFHMYN